MKKNKGFTLVELLAVIVVLALIMVIAIPAILRIMESSRKEAFYLYANSVYQKAYNKYVNDTNRIGQMDCSVFSIPKDLDIPNSGDYQGWVKVVRQPEASGNVAFNEVVSNANGIYYLKYCTSAKASCDPENFPANDPTYQNGTWNVPEGPDGKNETSTKIKVTAPSGYKMCYRYSYPQNGVLKKSGITCKNGTAIQGDTYKYVITLTMKDRERAVENVIMENGDENKDFKNTFYGYFDKYKAAHENEMRSLPVTELTCSGTGQVVTNPELDPNSTTIVTNPNGQAVITTQVTTTANQGNTTTVVTNNAQEERSTTRINNNSVGERQTRTVNSTTTTVRDNSSVNGTTTTSRQNGSVNGPTTTTRQNGEVSTRVVTTREVLEVSTKTTDVVDDSILLNNLSVAGYNINFLPAQLNYGVTVPYGTERLGIDYSTKHPDSKVQIIGADELKVGRNEVLVHVYNETTGKEINYNISVLRLSEPTSSGGGTVREDNPNYNQEDGKPDPTLEDSNAKLSRLVVPGRDFEEPFSSDMYEYDLEIEKETNSLTIVAVPQNNKADYFISGNENIKDGSVITVTVRSGNGYYTNVYKINVHVKKVKNGMAAVTRTILVGLVAVAAVLFLIINRQKRANSVIANNDNKDNLINNGGYVQPTQMNQNNNINNNNQGGV